MTDRTVELPTVPGLAGLYARGVATSARLAVARRSGGGPTTLPDVELVARGLTPDADHLTGYQHLVGESGSDGLPAGYVHVLAFPVATALMARTDFPLPLLGMVHVANRVTQRRAVRLGEVLDVRALARDLRAHRSGTQVDVVTEVSVADEVVWTGTSTYLAKGLHLVTPDPTDPADLANLADEADEPWSARADEPAGAPDPRVAGAWPTPTGRWRLGKDVGRRYAAVSGDRNPIHLSALSAKAFGFPRAIAHGMYTASRALADVGAARGEAYEWSVEFAKPVLLPSSPSVRVARDGDGFAFTVWRPGASAPHLTGRVDPLP